MIMHFDQYNNLNWADWELVLLVILMVFFTKKTRHVERKTIVCNTTKKCVQHVKLIVCQQEQIILYPHS